MIRRHPQDGATLVGRLDGYGPVADAILYHHEHVDGSGYPAGLIGNEIPLASRIVAICSTYDTLTARDSYRSPMTPEDAMAELRHVAGRQLDAELVEQLHRDARARRPVTFADGGRRLRDRARVRAARAQDGAAALRAERGIARRRAASRRLARRRASLTGRRCDRARGRSQGALKTRLGQLCLSTYCL